MGLRPEGHSPLGASGAYRWLPPPYGGGCTASVALTMGIEDEESEFASEGTNAHTLADLCLVSGIDAWTMIGEGQELTVTPDMAIAVQVYLDWVRTTFPNRNQGNFFVERGFYCPNLHEKFWGMSDLAHIDEDNGVLDVCDYKHGAGIVVEVPNNPQIMYYACGVLEELDLWAKISTVNLHIAQPRGWHKDGDIRSWSISTLDLEEWLDSVLLPGMDETAVSHDTNSGEHCRFCTARGMGCPQIIQDFIELEELMDQMEAAEELTNEQLGRFLDLFDVAKVANKAHGKKAYQRAMSDSPVPGRKLVKAKSNREFKKGADKEALDKFGAEAMTKPVVKSPAQIEKLAGGESFCARWSEKPDKGLCLAKSADNRAEINRDTKSMFQPMQKKGK